MGDTQNSTATRKVRPMRLFVYGCFIMLGIYGATQIFFPPTPADIVPVVVVPSESTYETTIVAFGDSVTAGYGIALDQAYPSILEQLLIAQGYSVRVINAGVSGETSAGGLRRVDFIKSLKPDVVILALGGNDVLRGLRPEDTKSNLKEIITQFKQEGIPVILVGMYAPNNLGGAYGVEFNTLYPALSTELEVPLVPFLLEGVALQKELNQNDGIHPNEAGAKIIAEKNILPSLVPLLQE